MSDNTYAAGGAASNPRRPVLAFIGHSGAGKDLAANYISAHTPLRFAGSMSTFLAPRLAARTGLPAETYLGPSRHAHAEEMFQLGEALRDEDPGILVRDALAAGEILAGLRDPREVDYARDNGLIDLFVFVKCDVPYDSTMRRFGPWPWKYADVIVDNVGKPPQFFRNLERLARAMGIPWRP